MSAPSIPTGRISIAAGSVISGGISKNPKACEDVESRDLPDNSNAQASDGLPRSMPPRLAIFNNIRATQNTSRGRTELYYGASSPFSVLQHLDAHLPMQGAPAVYPSPDGEKVSNGDRSIRSYNYQTIVFDHLPDPVPYLNGFDHTSYADAKIALRNFLVTACPRMPFLDQNIACNNFEKLFGRMGGTVLSTAERAIVVAALGLGAYPLADLPNRQLFLTQARAEAVTVMYDINTEAVHATLMLAQLEFEAGSPNICYLHLGGAIRKAFAAGVHRSETQVSKHTMWTLYCYESLICFTLGSHEPVRSTSAAVEQMVTRIQALHPEFASTAVPLSSEGDAFTATNDATQQGIFSKSHNNVPVGASNSPIPALTPAACDNEFLLDDLCFQLLPAARHTTIIAAPPNFSASSFLYHSTMNRTNATGYGAVGSHEVADDTKKTEQLLAGMMAFFLFAGIFPSCTSSLSIRTRFKVAGRPQITFG
ncbi:hypothetical protein E8E11_004275 [Didymella keratinophila]|nr:hypothetical protein E8E11_004275 [Didymella keratinophila]